MVFGLDDTDPQQTILRPRLPPGWGKAVATNWPVLVMGAPRRTSAIRFPPVFRSMKK